MECYFSDVIGLVCNEFNLEKSTQYHADEYVGVNYEGDMISETDVFMKVGLKKSFPIVVGAVPETSLEGEFCVKNMSLLHKHYHIMLLLISIPPIPLQIFNSLNNSLNDFGDKMQGSSS